MLAPSKDRLRLQDPCRGRAPRAGACLSLQCPRSPTFLERRSPWKISGKLAGDRSPVSAPPGDRSPASSSRAERLGKTTGAKDASDDSIWQELRSRREKAGRRIGEGWERTSENAETLCRRSLIGVALGSLGVGVAFGILIGAVAARTDSRTDYRCSLPISPETRRDAEPGRDKCRPSPSR